MPTPTYTPLATVTLGSSAASVTFSSIPATYRDLVLVIDGPALTSSEGNLYAIINGDTGANYSRVFMSGTGSSAYSASASGETVLNFGYYQPNKHTTIAQFMDYSATDKHKTVLSRVNNTNGEVYGWASRWASTSAITSLLIDTSSAGSFAATTSFALYGIAS
jgi:hypothetical protein